MNLHLPEELSNSYDVIEVLHSGTNSIVFLARQKRLQNLWAIKQIRKVDHPFFDPKNESILLHTIRHPMLPYVIGSFEDHESLYIVEEYIPGKTLDAYLKSFYGGESGSNNTRENAVENGNSTDHKSSDENSNESGSDHKSGRSGWSEKRFIEEKQVLQWFLQLSDVLSCLHHQFPPVIHRDIKPANIMLLPGGSLKLLDFSLAARLDPRDSLPPGKTPAIQANGSSFAPYSTPSPVPSSAAGRPQDGCGTLGYAAPEQFNFGTADTRADIYSLGATIFHLLTGKNPADSPYALPPVRQLNPSVSAGMEHIIHRCTRIRPEERYGSVDELRRDLLILEQQSSAFQSPRAQETSGTQQTKEKRKSPVLLFAALGLLLLISAAALFIFTRQKRPDPETSDPAAANASSDTTQEESSSLSAHIIKGDEYLELALKITDQIVSTGNLSKESLDERSGYYSSASDEYSDAAREGDPDAEERYASAEYLREIAAIDYDMLGAFEQLSTAFREDDLDLVFKLISENDTVRNSYCNVHHIQNAFYSDGDSSIIAGWPWTYYGSTRNGLPSGTGTAACPDRLIRVRMEGEWTDGTASGPAVETMENPSPTSSSGNFFLTRTRRGTMKDGVFDGEIEETLTYKITRMDGDGHTEDIVTSPFTIRYTIRDGSPVPVSAEDLPDDITWINMRRQEDGQSTSDIYAWSEEAGLLFYTDDYQSYTYRIENESDTAVQ